MATRFYESRNDDSSDNTHLKPMHLSHIHAASSASLTSSFGTPSSNVYHALEEEEENQDRTLHARDKTLERHIRLLRIISRLLATVVSAITLVPLLITIAKFLQTRDVYFDVDGTRRTAWAKGTVTWYTYVYTGVAGVSFVLNLIIMVSYCKGIRTANKAANVSTWWTWLVILGHVVAWAVAAGVYRYGKEPDKEGKHKDLWGWTCSDAAKDLQHVLTSVDFDKYCNVQSSSFYSGIANVVLGLLTVVITIMALCRTRTKKKRAARAAASSKAGTDLEPLRS